MNTKGNVFLICLLGAAMLLLSCVNYARAATNTVVAVVTGTNAPATKRYIVKLRDDADQERLVGEQKISRFHTFRHVFNGFVAHLDAAAAARLRNDPRVEHIEEDRIAAQETDQIVPTGVRRMAVDIFPPVKIDGTDKRVNVDVAVIDSGVQTNHPDLNVVQAVSSVASGGDMVDYPDSHGTECAGIIGALDNCYGVVGVAPGARIWSIRASSGGSFYSSDIVDAWDYVATHADQISVCSCSFGTIYGQDESANDYFYHPAIKALVNLGWSL